MRQKVVIRIVGLASTAKGFAYAVTEGPCRLVLWGLERGTGEKIPSALGRLMTTSRPLFVAFDKLASKRKRVRGRLFRVHVERACALHKVMLLQAEALNALNEKVDTKWDLARAMANQFRELGRSLPAKRRPWQSEDDRLGIFIALATSIAGWRGLKRGWC